MAKRPTPPSHCGELVKPKGPCVTTTTHRRCGGCFEWLKHSKFSRCKGKLLDLKDQCKKCCKARALEATPRRQELYFLRKYNLTLLEYDKMLARQAGRCAVCQSKKPGGRSGLFAVDHDHETGKIRGLLCNKCNTGLGLFDDDPDSLVNASTYLREHK